MSMPPLYDVDEALRQVAAVRAKPDVPMGYAMSVGADLAQHLIRHLSPEELESVGRALVVVAASLSGFVELASGHTEPHDTAVSRIAVNIVAMAGYQLAQDGRAAYS